MDTVYTQLIAAYSTPEALLAYLQSEAGGSLRVSRPAAAGDPHVLIHYPKARSEEVAAAAEGGLPPHVRFFRSVVWNTATHRPVALSPVKAEAEESLGAALAAAEDGGLVAEEFVDGVMINTWHDGAVWRLATRTRLDASAGFHTRRSFADLFGEACAASDVAHLQPGLCYTWALQHPDNRIVAPVPAPRAVLLQVAAVDAATGGVRLLDPRAAAAAAPPLPALYPCTPGLTLAAVRERVATEGARLGLAFQGLVFKQAATGRRWKLRSPTYAGVKELRGNDPDIDFVLLSRVAEGRLPAYLAAYPEEAPRCAALQGAYEAAAQAAEAWHTAVFKQRRCEWPAVPLGLQPLVRALEDHYRAVVRPEGGRMTPALCEAVLAAQDPARKLWVVRRCGAAPLHPPQPQAAKRLRTDAAEAAVMQEEGGEAARRDGSRRSRRGGRTQAQGAHH